MGVEPSFLFAFLDAGKPEAVGLASVIVQRVIRRWLAEHAGCPRETVQCSGLERIQRFRSVLNLSVEVHRLWIDGVHEDITQATQAAPAPMRALASAQLMRLLEVIADRARRRSARRGSLGGEGESA